MTRRRALIAGGVAIVVIALLAALSVRLRPAYESASRRARAERLYDARSFEDAYDAFASMVRDAPRADPVTLAPIEYDAGSAAYRRGHFDAAVRHFRAALAGPPELVQRAQYNLGNAYVWLARGETDKRGWLRSAVNAYESAVLLDPSDTNAKWNLELASARLATEQARINGTLHRGEANWGGGNLTKSGYEGTPQTGAGATPGGGFGAGGGEGAVPELSVSDARRMLAETERASITGQVARPPARRTRPERRKDW